MALPPRDQRHQYLRFEGLKYLDADIMNFKERLGKIYDRGVCLLAELRGGYLRFKARWGATVPVRSDDRLCHRLIACNIAGRSQAPKKICKELDDTWAWVAPGLERQPDPAASALEVAKGVLDVDEGA
uniref:Uncharacterized protein n=1 Tax=Tanacetum cinerariifolium TaxID=118510 RepID=A0A6L2JVH2_TANCI|nr:hypothetical protein [Tanacetum cinerariifolium]